MGGAGPDQGERPLGGAQAAPALSVERLRVRLGGRTVLDDVSFTIGPGRLVGLIGSNGAGKTTLLRAIVGLQRPSSGTIRLARPERPERPLSRFARREPAVGYVPQRFLFDPDLPVRARDLVALGLDGHRLGLRLPSRERDRAVQEMLEAVDARAFADARVGELSGGEQQRVLIAHALIARPLLLALDEPLANLDLRAAQEVVALLRRLARERSLAVLISAHEINPLLPAMDGVVYLAGGRAASGSVEQVIRSEVLSSLYGHHVDVLRVHGRVIVLAGTGQSEHSAHAGEDVPPVEIV